MIDGKKMSASLGNVVYPHEWLTVASPELLRYFYNKRLMKTRSFSWRDLPALYDEYDRTGDVYFGAAKVENKKEESHLKRLFEISQLKKPAKRFHIPYDFASLVAQVAGSDTGKAVQMLRNAGHVAGTLKAQDKKDLAARLALAKQWAENYAPEDYRVRLHDQPPPEGLRQLAARQKAALKALAQELEGRDLTEEVLYGRFFEIARSSGLDPKEFFRAAYLVLLGKPAGPRLAPFILAVGRQRVADLLKQV
jgi:lysyl-tRNA synthetase class 1